MKNNFGIFGESNNKGMKRSQHSMWRKEFKKKL
jgi:hypothetical protein